MAQAKERREKLSIYLAKDANASDAQLIDTTKTKQPVNLDIPECTATLYGKKYMPANYPKWASFLTSTNLKSLEDILEKTSSTGAVLIVRAYQKTFVLTFGTSFHIVQSNSIERDFGLRVTLNSVDPQKLRGLDKASYSSNPLNSRNQSTIDADIFDLSINAETDLVYALTGASKVGIFGTQVTGRDALVINPYVTLDTLYLILKKALEQYSKPLPTEFEWIDNLNRIRDEANIISLDAELDKHLSAKKSNAVIWLGEPEIVDWEEHLGYSFDLRPKTERHVVLELQDLQDYLNKQSIAFNCSNLRAQKIHINDNDYKASKTWSAYRCVYAEIKVLQEQFILRNGIWYRVNNSLIAEVDSYLGNLETYPHQLLEYNHDNEGLYNEALCSSDASYTLMDKKNIQFGGAYSKIEFCDAIKGTKDFIHVKYYRSSSTLSHLFAQGVVSAEAFVSDTIFRKKLNAKLPKSLKLLDVDVRPNSSEYCVVYAIATKKQGADELPFFSKVALKNSAKRLGGMGFKVQIAFIKIHPHLLIKKKAKPAKAKGAGIKKHP